MKTIVIVEILWNGHHPTYVNLFANILLQQGYQVVVLCPKPEEVSAYIQKNIPDKLQHLIADRLDDVSLPPMKLPGMGSLLPTFFRWYTTASAIKKASQKFRFDVHCVFFSCLDIFIYYTNSSLRSKFLCQLVEIIFPFKWIGLLLHTNYDGAAINPDVYKIIKSKKCQAITVLNESSASKLENLGKKIFVLPDIADDTFPDTNYSLAQQVKEKANGRSIIGLLGYLEKRKNLISLIEIAKRSIEKPYFFLFAGFFDENSFSPDEASTIIDFYQSNPSNCFFHFERIPLESQFNRLIDQCNVLYAVYENFPSSSNILTKAAIFQKPLLVARGYSMANNVKEFNLGISVDSNNLSEQMIALETLLDQDQFYKNIDQPKFEEYKRYHSIDNLKSIFNRLFYDFA